MQCPKDAYGNGQHVSIDVVALVFEGKLAINQYIVDLYIRKLGRIARNSLCCGSIKDT